MRMQLHIRRTQCGGYTQAIEYVENVERHRSRTYTCIAASTALLCECNFVLFARGSSYRTNGFFRSGFSIIFFFSSIFVQTVLHSTYSYALILWPKIGREDDTHYFRRDKNIIETETTSVSTILSAMQSRYCVCISRTGPSPHSVSFMEYSIIV